MELEKTPQVTYDISEKAAEKLFSRIHHLVNTCDKDLKYQFLGSNCFDFVQDMVLRAGLEVDILEDVTGFKTPANIFGMYKLLEEVRVSAKLVGSASKQVAENIVPQIELPRALYPMA